MALELLKQVDWVQVLTDVAITAWEVLAGVLGVGTIGALATQ